MMKKSLMYIPFFNLTCWLCSVIFVDRFNHEKAMQAVEKCSRALTEKNLNLWIFPEGTRNVNLDGFLKFKLGCFNLAVNAQIPIIPTVTSSFKGFYSHPEHYFESDGEVIVEVMDPIPTKGLTQDDVPRLAEEVREKMLVVYDRLTKEANERMAAKRAAKLKTN